MIQLGGTADNEIVNKSKANDFKQHAQNKQFSSLSTLNIPSNHSPLHFTML